MSKELHDNKEKTTGTLLFLKAAGYVYLPPKKITEVSWCLEGYLVSSF